MAAKDLTAARLRELMTYNPESGLFTRLVRVSNNAPAGATAGTLNGAGYLVVSVDGHQYLAHRLAWLFVLGRWPDGHIDHIDGNGTNNSIQNLRDVDRSTNQENQRSPHRGSASGVLGVAWCKKGRNWRARIVVRGLKRDLGQFDTKELAHEAYLEAKRKLHAGCTL